MTVKVLHAGDGYTYLTRQVATADHQRGRGDNLSDYYLEHGNPPGRWVGAGTTELGVSGQVDEAQMKALFGAGVHPDADRIVAEQTQGGTSARDALASVQLGRRWPAFDLSREQVWRQTVADQRGAIAHRDGVAVTDLTREQSQEARSDAGLVLFGAEKGRAPETEEELRKFIARRSKPTPQPVAGYDLVFTPAKSISVLWALGDDATRRAVEDAHREAIGDVVAYLEDEVAFTRSGAGGVAQIDTRGIVATAFDHVDSRAGDPGLHTHLAVANKVQGVDGKWRSLDGRVIFQAGVSASERYNTRVERGLRRRLGVTFEDRESTSGRRPVREVSGVDPLLVTAFSTRRAVIENRYAELLAEHRSRYGKEPGRDVQYELAQQATLETREAKGDVEPLTEKRARWRTEAVSVVGEQSVERLIEECRSVAPRGDRDVVDDLSGVVDQVMGRLEQDRSSWRVWHVRAEAERATRDLGGDTGEDLVERVVDAVVARSVARQAVPGDEVPAELRRRSGESVFRMHGHLRMTSQTVLDAEDRLLMASDVPARAPVRARRVGPSLEAWETATGTQLKAGQRAVVEAFAARDRMLVAAVGPAGTGKTTAMAAFAHLVRESGGRVVGLAPSAAAAAVLTDDIGAPAHTVAKVLWDAEHGADQRVDGSGAQASTEVQAGDVLLVDEAAMTATGDLDKLVRLAAERGAVVRLIGDPAQLSAVEAGGAMRLLVHRTDAVELSEVARFADPAEAQATLGLRAGDPAALEFYENAGRVHAGTLDALTDAVYSAWQTDTAAGRVSVMVASSNEAVQRLSDRARTDRIAAGEVEESGVQLRTGSRAGAGDVVVTRRNNRRLAVGATDFVKNRDLWTVLDRAEDGSLTVKHLSHGGSVTLPADYVAAHVELGYAFTVHQVQGMTVDVSRSIIDPGMDRSGLYVAATRGREENDLYVVTDEALDVDLDHRPERPETSEEVLATVLARQPENVSAHEALETDREQAASLAQLEPQLDHALGLYHSRRLGPVVDDALDRVRGDAGVERDQLLEEPGWPALAGRLAQIQAAGRDPAQAMADAVDEGDLGRVASRTQVIGWRLDSLGWTDPRQDDGTRPGAPVAGVDVDDDLGRWIHRRHDAIGDRRREVTDRLVDQQPSWAWDLLGPQPPAGQDGPWRAAAGRVAGYRDRYEVVDQSSALGVRPDAQGTQRRAYDAAVAAADAARGQNPSESSRGRSGPSYAERMRQRLEEAERRGAEQARRRDDEREADVGRPDDPRERERGGRER